jgi:two-component system, NtrC family, sensor kinase
MLRPRSEAKAMSTSKQAATSEILRQRAERRLNLTRDDISSMSSEDIQLLIHELQVHQIELELQNEELRRIQAELTESRDRAQRCEHLASLGTLAAGIAHEINNPLCMIDLQTEVARAAENKPDRAFRQAACFREIKALVKRGGKIVESVLRFANQDASQRWHCSLNDVLGRARDFTRALAAKKGVTVTLELSSRLPKVVVNPTEMEQVFVNLLSNAVEACSRGGAVRVSSSWSESHVVVCVQDDGCGVSEGDLESIFDPFFTKRRKFGHSGLGLSVVHGIVEDHEGKIDARSEPGRGTTFTVSLPVTGLPNEARHSHVNSPGR